MARAQPTLQAVAGSAPPFSAGRRAPRWGLAIGAVAAIGLLSVNRRPGVPLLAILMRASAAAICSGVPPDWSASCCCAAASPCWSIRTTSSAQARLPALNLLHPRANDQMIASRAHLAARSRPRTLLLGNSRIEAGLDPASSAWPRSMTPVFDGGLPGMNLEAAHRVMEAAMAGGRLNRIVVAVEFLDTLDNSEGAPHPHRQSACRYNR